MSSTETRASVAHRGYGRTRLRFRSERGNQPFFEKLGSRLTALPGVLQVETRPHTGSVLLFHQCSWPELAERVSGTGLFAIVEEEKTTEPLEADPLSLMLPPPLIAAGSLTALAAWQILRGHSLPPAITLLWYGYELTNRFFANANKE